MPLSDPSPFEEYRQRQRNREARVSRFETIHIRLGYVRLLLFVATLFVAWCCFERHTLSAWWLLVPALLFVATAIVHSKVLQRRSCAERAVEVYRKGLARIEDRWADSGHQGEDIDISSSLYAADLNLFGHASLFELLSLARTRMGEDTLAHWLLHPSTREEIAERHVVITELRDKLDLREDFAVLGEDLKVGVRPGELTRWAEAPSQLTKFGVRWAALILAIAAVATAVVWGKTGMKAPFFFVVIVEGGIAASLRKPIKEILRSTQSALEDVQLLTSLLKRLEHEAFESPRLQEIKWQLVSHQIGASRAVGRLQTIVQCIESLDNPVMRLADIPLLYSVQVAYAAEAWRRDHGGAIRAWLSAIGETEALLSLAAYSYEHPADPFPEFVEGEAAFHADGLGHPLIAAARCVRNDVHLSGEIKVLLVSGSNMSGKSTLLRSVGINTVLAMAGAPVRARRMQLTPLRLGASILVNDSLFEGSSRFYAEIKRLRQICVLAEQEPPVLFLLDELLQGTNSRDRLAGAEGVLRALLASGAIGLLSTHDLALTEMGDHTQGHVSNVHFHDDIVDGKMKFDFTLQEGVVSKSNGIELMRLIGIDI